MSTVAPSPPELTADDVLQMSDDIQYELVDGRLVEKEMSFKSQYHAAQLARILGNYCDPIGLAYVLVECGYTCFPSKPKQMRRPDVSCVLVDRLPSFEGFDDGFLSTRPDLAVEIISPNDLIYDLEWKLADYRDAGIPLIWLLYPPIRMIRVLRPQGPTTELGPDDELSGEDILPGFRCRAADLFAGPVRVGADPTP